MRRDHAASPWPRLAVLILTGACYLPATRLPLPAPFPLTNGATPVPGKGAGVSVELADALRGPELGRGEVTGGGVAAGVADAASLVYAYQETDDRLAGGGSLHTGVRMLRLKVRVGAPFGPRSLLGIHASSAWSDRWEGDPQGPLGAVLQDDAVRTGDLAVPVEFVVGVPRPSGYTSFFIGPRLIAERYDDRVRPGESFRTLFPGMVGGFHASFWVMELFVETTWAYVPPNTYQGVRYGGRVTVMPALGLMVRVGPRYRWPLAAAGDVTGSRRAPPRSPRRRTPR